MAKHHSPVFGCVFLFLFVITGARADSDYSLKRVTPRSQRAVASVAVSKAGNSADNVEMRWQARAVVDIASPGLVEAALVPGLHKAVKIRHGRMKSRLDLCLFGPDGQSRSFELFWREKGRPETVDLDREKAELTADRRLLWEGVVPEGFMADRLMIDIAADDYVGKVDVEALTDAGWVFLVKDAALYQNHRTRQAEIAIEKGVYRRFRLRFKGFDEKFGETPLFVHRVQAAGAQSGRDHQTASFRPEFSISKNEQTTEVRMTLPGSGIWIRNITINTGALFQGTWQLGREKVVLGKREFSVIKTGRVSHVGENEQVFSVDVGREWPDRVLVTRMTSPDFFGEIQNVVIQARIPRMVFYADTPGRYTVQTGCENPITVLERAGDPERRIDHQAILSDLTRNTREINKTLVEKYDITGGPFSPDGYAWQAAVRIDAPGFYQVVLNERVCLEEQVTKLRLVINDAQVPYFPGGRQTREVRLDTAEAYDAGKNRSVYIIKLPFASANWSGIRLNAAGLFERTLAFQKHTPGRVGWQPWKTRKWISRQDQDTDFYLDLDDFPGDQDEIRLMIEHGDNQPLDIGKIFAVYNARDLFFLAAAPGTYKLFGGNPKAVPVAYKDFEIIKQELLSAVPEQVGMGEITAISFVEKDGPVGRDVAGGPFNGIGYTWSSSLKDVTKPGFYRLRLNRKAALEDNRRGLRLVRDNQQVPFFMGEPRPERIALPVEKEYDREKNQTIWKTGLPQPSVHWRKIRLVAEGVFSRTVSFAYQKPGNTGWQSWRRENWTNRNAGESILEIPIRLPAGRTDIRLTMWHGDNKPLDLKRVEAVYTTQDMFFIAGRPGGYELVGGNPDASAPSYDLALIKNHILTKEPVPITMDEIEKRKPAGWKTAIGHAFSEQGWGLYAVLGLVTLILLIVIVRLFPKEETGGNSE